MDFVTPLLTGGVVVALIGILSKYLEIRWNKQNVIVPVDKTINTIANIYMIMNELLEKTKADSFIIFKAENGGGIPRLGAHLYISALMESQKSLVQHHAISDYQRLQVDAEYIDLLSEILSKGHRTYLTDKMKPSLLRSIYLKNKFKASQIYLIHTSKDAVYYCSVATTQDHSVFDEVFDFEMGLSLSKIQAIFKTMIK